MELLSLISMLGYALFWQRRREPVASIALLHSVSAMIVVLFVASLLNLLFPVTILLLAGGLVLSTAEALRIFRNKQAVPVPLGVLFFLSLVYWSVHSGSSLFYYDEYSHWGVYIKEMLARNSLWGADTNAMHPRYLPGTSLWQYFFAIFSGNPEGAAYLGQFTLLLTPLMVLWEKLRWRQYVWLVGVLALVVIALFNFGHGFTSLYVDHLLSTWFVGILLNYLIDKRRQVLGQLLLYLLPLAILALIKTTGVFFALAGAGIVALLILVRKDADGTMQSLTMRWQRTILFPFATAIICVSILSVWSFNRDSLDVVAGQGAATSIVSGLASRESVLTDSQQAELTRRFIEVVLHQQISKDEISSQYNAFSYPVMPAYTDYLRLTTASLFGFSLIAIFLLWYAVLPVAQRTEWVVAAGSVWLAAAVYVAALYLGYLYTSTSDYGLLLSSYVRYAHSMLLPVVLFCFASLLPIFAGKDIPEVKLGEKLIVPRHAAAFFALLLALCVVERPYLATLYQSQPPHPFRVQAEPLTEAIRTSTGSSRLWVFFPNNVTNGVIGQMLQYLLSPGQVYVEENADTLLDNPQDLKSELLDWDYVWFADKSPTYRDASALLIGQDVGNGLFRVEADASGVRFVAVPDTPTTAGER